MRTATENTQRCTGCKTEKPLTPEYWYRQRGEPRGFALRCKVCRRQAEQLARTRAYRPSRARLGAIEPAIQEIMELICREFAGAKLPMPVDLRSRIQDIVQRHLGLEQDDEC